MAARKLQDFGEKIGGAKKDLWGGAGLNIGAMGAMTDLERNKYCRKDYVWPRPNWEKLRAAGEDQKLLFWKNEMRKVLPPAPLVRASDKGNLEACRAAQDAYVSFCASYRDAVMAIHTDEEARNFSKDFLIGKGYLAEKENAWGRKNYEPQPQAAYCISDKMYKCGNLSADGLQRMGMQAARELFGIPKERKTYESVKQNLKAIPLDGSYCKVENDDRYDGVRVTLSANGHSIFFYDRNDNAKPEDYIQGKVLVLNTGNNSIVEKNLDSLAEADAYIEKKAVQMQEFEDNLNDNLKGSSNRKKNFAFLQLESARRTGPDYLQGRAATEKDFLDELKFRGGEYGNWVSDAERRESLSLAYQSFRDLARVLNIKPEDVSLDGQLAIAFGARGRGGKNAAAAHYERERTVINLTRYSGAGCLAHEWGHAFDDFLGKKLNLPINDMLSDAVDQRKYKDKLEKAPKAMVEIIRLMKTKQSAMSQEQAEKVKAAAVELANKSINRWLDSVMPLKMTEEQAATWEKLCKEFIDGRDALTGGEYFTIRRLSTPPTYAPMEALSNFKKQVTGHIIGKENKFQITNALHQYKNVVDRPLSEYMQEKAVETDYYKGSKEFDALFAKESQGYWSSNREMFARAFDCYVEDKLKAEGVKSSYLTSHASGYQYKNHEGKIIRAYPEGEERKELNEKFDELIAEVKELGLFHEAEKEQELSVTQSEQAEKVPAEKAIVLNESAVNEFLNSTAITSIEPRNMTAEQKEQWLTAAENILQNQTPESFEALSNLRKELVGREIPSFNQKMIERAANCIVENLKREASIDRQLDKVASRNQPEAEPKQLSFADLMR